MAVEKVNINLEHLESTPRFGSITMPGLFSNLSVFGCGSFNFQQYSPFMNCFNYFNNFSESCFNIYQSCNTSDFSNSSNTITNFQNNTFNIANNFEIPKFNINWNDNPPIPTPNLSNLNINMLDTFTPSKIKKPRTLTNIEKTPFKLKGGRLEIEGYNANKGEKFAQKILDNARYYIDTETNQLTQRQKSIGTFTGNCARHVKRAMADINLGKYQSGHACSMINMLDHNSNFKRISSSGINVKKLPAGCILVYGKGVAGYNKNYGHVEVTLGDDRACSDGITNNIRPNPTAIYVPV